MRTSWTKLSGLMLFAAAVAYGCSSDSTTPTPPPAEAGSDCGNNKIDGKEVCDGTALGGKTCATAMLSSGAVGTLKCKSDCSGYEASSCNKGAGGGGGVSSTGGAPGATGGAPSGGKKGMDGGLDSGLDSGKDSGKTGSGGTTGTGGTAATDAGDAKAP